MQWHISPKVISVNLHFSTFFVFIYWKFKCIFPVLLSYLSCDEFFSFFWKVMLCHCVHSCWSSFFRRITVTVPSLSHLTMKIKALWSLRKPGAAHHWHIITSHGSCVFSSTAVRTIYLATVQKFRDEMWIACLTQRLPYAFCVKKAQKRTTRKQQPYAMLFTISTENGNDSWCRSHWETLRDPQWRSINVRMFEVWCNCPAHPQYSGQHSRQQVLYEVTRSHCIVFLNGTITT
jgi:hypothetical protein